MAGEKLLFDLRRMQIEHLKNNTRELEMTKHVSLLQIAPDQLINLRKTGECFIALPEKLFDLDQPGQYLRRIKSVSVTLPCVTGPYTTINATLTLQKQSTRMTHELTGGGNGYPSSVDGDGFPNDGRFLTSSPAQVIALSTGREDTGVFELNLHDERYLPFEGQGAISLWHLELPRDTNHFDLSTLSDVVMHLRYTARYEPDNSPDSFRRKAHDAAFAPPRNGLQLLSARTEFPDAYAKLFAPTGTDQRLQLALGPEHFPYILTSQQITISSVRAILLFTSGQTYADYAAMPANQRLKAHLGFTPNDGTMPTTTPLFTSVDSVLGGVPVAAQTLSGSIGAMTLGFVEADIHATPLLEKLETVATTTHSRLNRDKIDDILILVAYSIA
jgi:hypothetical protein